jgi:Ca2+-binding EF-hand superfamily protein
VQRDVWTRLDIDGDGRISSTEGAADTDFNTGFATMDADHDGFVSDIEYRTAAKAEMEKGRGASDASERSATGSGDALRRLDANADGSISRSEGEADAAFKANFAAIDSDSDGTVTRAEYQAWLKANRR